MPPGRTSRGGAKLLPTSPTGELDAEYFILDWDWSAFYEASDGYGEVWKKLHGAQDPWPEGFKIIDGKLYRHEKLCVPEDIVTEVLRAHHEWLGHIGNDRLILEVDRRYELPPGFEFRKMLQNIRRNCLVCQACDRPNWALKNRIAMTPIPERFMASVCLDVFTMPDAEWEGKSYDADLLCVDRHSGWTIAKPTNKAGLTGERAALGCWASPE